MGNEHKEAVEDRGGAAAAALMILITAGAVVTTVSFALHLDAFDGVIGAFMWLIAHAAFRALRREPWSDADRAGIRFVCVWLGALIVAASAGGGLAELLAHQNASVGAQLGLPVLAFFSALAVWLVGAKLTVGVPSLSGE